MVNCVRSSFENCVHACISAAERVASRASPSREVETTILMIFCHTKRDRGEFVRKWVERPLTLFFVHFYRSSASDNVACFKLNATGETPQSWHELSATFLVKVNWYWFKPSYLTMNDVFRFVFIAERNSEKVNTYFNKDMTRKQHV